MQIFILNREEEVVSVLSGNADNSACHFFNAVMTRELNKGANLTFTVDMDELGEEAQHIVEENMVVVQDGDEFRLFVIKETTDLHETDFTKEVYCEDCSIELGDEVLTFNLVGKYEIANALKLLLAGTRWEVGEVSDTYIRSLSGEYMGNSVLNGITTLAGEYEVEFDFSVSFVGNRVTGRYVHVKQAFGRTLGKRFEYKKDITSVTRTVNTGDIKTAIIPYGKEIKQSGEGETEETPVETLSARTITAPEGRVNIADVLWTTPENPRNKPLGQYYLEDTEATKQWGYKNPDGSYRPRWIMMEFSDCESPEELISMANLQLSRYTTPKVSYEVAVQDLYLLTGDNDFAFETVKLGDLVNIIDHDFTPSLVLSSRVVKIEHDLNYPDQTVLTLGTIVPSIVDKDLQTQLNELNYKVSNSASSTDLSGVINRIESVEGNIQSGAWETVQEINNQLFGESLGYQYIEGENGIWVYDRPKDQNPTKAVVLKGGQIGLATWDLQLQKWTVGTFIDGLSVNANYINTGTLKADLIEAGGIKVEHLTPALKEDIDNKVTQGVVESLIESTRTSIELSVSSKYETKEDSQSKIDDLKIGGTNLIIRTDEEQDVCIDDGGVLFPTVGHSASIFPIAVTEGETLAFWKDGNIGEITDNNFRWIFKNVDGVQVERTFNDSNQFFLTVPEGAATLEVSYPTISKVKIERGTKHTDYSPAPEDVDFELDKKADSDKVYTMEQIDEQMASIQITDDRIIQVVGDSFVRQDELTGAVEELETNISAVEQTATEMNISFTSQLQDKADSSDFESLKTDVTTNITFNEDGITLGKTDSSFKVQISNTQISFLDNGDEVAYISNNKLYITNGEIVNQMILGGFKIEPRESGNLSFMWNE